MAMKVYGRQIEQQTPQAAQAPVGAFGGQIAEAAKGLGAAVQDAGQLVAQRAVELQEREDARKTLEIETKFRQELDVLLYDKEKGLTNRKLSAASGVTTTYDQEVAALKQKYLQELPGVTQKEQFGAAADGHIQAGRGAILKYETGEIRKGEEITLKDSLDKNAADVMKDPTQENLDRLIQDSTTKITTFGKTRGLTPEMIEAETTKEAGHLAGQAVAQALANNDVALAGALYDQYKDKIGAFSADASLQLKGAIQKADLAQADATVKKLVTDAAAIQTDESLAALVSQAGSTVDGQGKYGFGEDILESEKEATVGQIVTNAIATALTVEKDPAKAQKFLEKYRDQMDAPTAAKLQATIEAATFTTKLDTLWETRFSKFTLPDGTPDVRRITEELEKEYTGDELERAKSHVYQLANQAEAFTNAERSARQKAFTDAVDGIYLKKGGKAQALALLKTAGFNPHDYLLNQNYIEDLFKPPEAKQQGDGGGTYVSLYEWITKEAAGQPPNGRKIKTADIDAAYETGALSTAEWKSLRLKYVNEIVEGQLTKQQALGQKQVLDYIERQAALRYPGSKQKQDRNDFVNYYTGQAAGKPLPEVIALIEADLKQGKSFWEKNFQGQEAVEKEVWTSYYGTFQNTDVVTKIMDGVRGMKKGGGAVTAADMSVFEAAIGGLGQSQVNAILSLYRAGKAITPFSIVAVLKQEPSGVLPKSAFAR